MTSSRLSAVFEKARGQKRCALIPFIMAGDPDLETGRAVLQAIGDAGADLIELGVPYSDPLADGPSIIAAGQRALEAGAQMAYVLELVRASKKPTLLFTYANPVVQYGVERLARDLAEADGYGAIIPDLPLEEARKIAQVFKQYHLEIPLLVAPTTKRERAKLIVAESGGFVYLVSRLGVTGAGATFATDAVEAQVRQLRSLTSLPIAVGFGISTRAHVAAIAHVADGAVVGSALIDAIAGSSDAAQAAAEFVGDLRAGTNVDTAENKSFA